jgi:predicted PurR-regulated permease PerM
LISLALAAALRPLFTRLAGRGWMVRTAWTLLYLAVLVGFGYLLFLAGEAALNEIQRLANAVAVLDEWRLSLWLEGSPFEQALVARLPPPSKLFEAVTGDQGQLVPSAILSLTQRIGNVLSKIFAILLLSIYWVIHQTHFERLWLSLLPSGQRIQARSIWQTVEADIGAYLRGAVFQSILTGSLLGLGYWLLGSPYPALLGIAGALAGLIPMVGIVLTIIPVLLIGLLTSLQRPTTVSARWSSCLPRVWAVRL